MVIRISLTRLNGCIEGILIWWEGAGGILGKSAGRIESLVEIEKDPAIFLHGFRVVIASLGISFFAVR